MKNVALLFFFLICSMVIAAEESGQQTVSKKGMAPRAMCDAAALKLHESGTNNIVLVLTLDTRGRVESFRTESPKDLRLEKMKKATTAIKAMQFEPAKKDGRPVRALVKGEFDCSEQATDTSKNP